MRKLVYLLVILLVAFLVAAGVYTWKDQQARHSIEERLVNTAVHSTPSSEPTPTPSAQETPTTPRVTTSATDTGIITGSLSFPGESIPPMQVCAEHLITHSGVVVCTTEHTPDPAAASGVGYRLEVPPGSYFVYAKLPSDTYKAYYSEFVQCGLHVGCFSHDPVAVEVRAGQTVEGIDPHDWYNQ